MDAHEELVLRLAAKRRRKLGLSDSGYAELLLAVRRDPTAFYEDDGDEAFAIVAEALDRFERSRRDDDLRDDPEFLNERSSRMARMRSDCARALRLDPDCTDAQLLSTLALDQDPDPQLDDLLAVGHGVREGADGRYGDMWDDVLSRPSLRVRAAIARTCLDSARYRMAADVCEGMLADSERDVLGARHTYALALARLEDEGAFDSLDARLGRRGDSWVQLGRVILFYKLGRPAAARRALRGMSDLCEGGIYALLRPVMVDTYMPDRPAAEPYSFEEATLAVHEADPIVVDVPDFVSWVEVQPGMLDAAEAYARRTGLDW